MSGITDAYIAGKRDGLCQVVTLLTNLSNSISEPYLIDQEAYDAAKNCFINAIKEVSSLIPKSPKPVTDVVVSAGALTMVMNALQRDADEGKVSRAEMLEELRKTIRGIE